MTEDKLAELEGTLERLTFQNEESGYTIAKIIPKGKTYEVAVVGDLSGVQVGELVRLRGIWTTHPRYGQQFEARFCAVQLPATIEGLRKYLGSGLIKGIGPVNAGRIVDYFGLQTLAVIEQTPDRLRETPGIGPLRAARIAAAWQEQKQIKEIMLFLQSHGVTTGLAVKIYKQYGDKATAIVRNDPYRLAKDIYGIGFKTADKIAQQMGFALDSPERLRAGVRYALGAISDAGHCYATRAQLLEKAAELLEASADLCAAQLDALIAAEEVVDEQTPAAGEHAIYLPPFFYAEVGVARKLCRLHAHPQDRLAQFQAVDWERAFAWLDAQSPFRLAEQQRAGVRMALTERVSLLTGGPGAGKSTITGSIIRLLQAKGGSVLLAAPTGRAAKRLSEATGLEAKTLHRLLEFNPGAGNTFLRDHENPLDADLVIVDEVSMVDLLLMNHLVKAIGLGSHLLLVGDVDQLPAVGAGNVLRDLIASGVFPVTRLETIYRQAEDSFITVNAHRINHGDLPLFERNARDFFLFSESDPERAADLLLDLVVQRIPARFGYDPLHDIQVLCPMHRGAVGVGELNRRLQARLNPPAPAKGEHVYGQRVFRVGDRVMQIRNDYDKQVFNGDMGWVSRVDLEEGLVVVTFDGAAVEYEFAQLDELVHAYAVSIHKAQGAEFPVVVIPLLVQHYMMLQRNLLYTGVTRARERVVLVGERRAIAMAVRNDKITRRNTRLAQRLRDVQPIVAPATAFAYPREKRG